MFVLTAFLLGLAVYCPGQETDRNRISSVSLSNVAIEVEIKAREIERSKDRIYAKGDVEARAGELSLFADYLEFNTETGDVLAEGNVTLMMPAEVTRADRLFINLQSGEGRLELASGLIRPNLIFEADDIQRKQSGEYGLRKASFTICTQPVPRWSFYVASASLTADGELKLKSALLKVKKLPVFYLPYLRFPLLKERASGFLVPRIGFSAEKGFFLSQSYYLAIAPNMDATLAVDYYSARGLGAGVEYRYLFSPRTRGQLNLYSFLARKSSSASGVPSSSIIRFNHHQILPLNFALTAEVDYQTSFNFLREFDDNFRRAVVSNRTAQVFMTRTWNNFSLSTRVSRYETYYSEIDNSLLHTLAPQVNFDVLKVRLFSPVYFSLNSSFQKSAYGWKSEFDENRASELARFSFRPALIMPLNPLAWLSTSASLTANLDWYSRSLDPETGRLISEPLKAANYSFKMDIVGPVLYRIFYSRAGESRIKHVVEPTFEFLYDSPVKDADRIWRAGGYFRVHQLNYGLVNRWLLKNGQQVREVAVFSLSQSYFFSPETGPLSRYLVNGRPPRFSEIIGTLRYYPDDELGLDVRAGYNPYTGKISSFRISSTLGTKTAGNFLSAHWTKSENAWEYGHDPLLLMIANRNEFSLFAGLKLPAPALELQVEVDYSLRDKKFHYTGSRAIYHYQCVDFQLDVRVYYFRSSPEFQVRFSLSLGSISRAAEFLGGLGF